MSIPRLTTLVQGGGWARKLPAESLVQVLNNIPAIAHPWLDKTTGPMDDAAIVHPSGEHGLGQRALVLTIDVITPIVDDPRAFGGIAAANSMSDVWAMGGRPQVALSFVGMPTDKLPIDILGEVLLGMQQACARAGCAIVGGHTIADAEPKCGLAVIGSVDSRRVWTHAAARPGNVLILTKALGTGIVGQAIRAGTASDDLIARATSQMLALNNSACEVGLAVGATSCTDITGFGLLGHLRNLIEASNVSATLVASQIPLIQGVLPLVEAGTVPGGSRRNLTYASHVTDFDETVPDSLRLVLADAQTSGGLLLCVPEENAATAMQCLREAGCADAALIGILQPAGQGSRIHVQ